MVLTAIDASGNDITEKIEVVENTVDTSKEGEYKVVYKVVDDNGKEASKEIKVTVAKDGEVEEPGEDDDSNKPGTDTKPGDGNNNNNNSSNNNNSNNSKPGVIPQTGGTNTIYYIIIALVLVAGGVYFTFRKKKVS